MEQQWEEFECMRSMFPEREELQFDNELVDQYEHHVYTNGPRPDARLQYTIRYKVHHSQRNLYFYRASLSIKLEKCIPSQPFHEIDSTTQCNDALCLYAQL